MLQLIYHKNKFQISNQALDLFKTELKKRLSDDLDLLRVAIAKNLKSDEKQPNICKLLEEMLLEGQVAAQTLDVAPSVESAPRLLLELE